MGNLEKIRYSLDACAQIQGMYNGDRSQIAVYCHTDIVKFLVENYIGLDGSNFEACGTLPMAAGSSDWMGIWWVSFSVPARSL